MIEIILPGHSIISFDGRVFEYFCLCVASDHKRYHIAQIKNIEIKTNKRNKHKLVITFILPFQAMELYIPNEIVDRVKELINTINETKSSTN